MEKLRIGLLVGFLAGCLLLVGAVEKQVNDARQRQAMMQCHTDTECEAADGREI